MTKLFSKVLAPFYIPEAVCEGCSFPRLCWKVFSLSASFAAAVAGRGGGDGCAVWLWLVFP